MPLGHKNCRFWLQEQGFPSTPNTGKAGFSGWMPASPAHTACAAEMFDTRGLPLDLQITALTLDPLVLSRA